MNPLHPHQGNYNNSPREMHTWNGYNGPQDPNPYYPYPPPMHAYPPPPHYGMFSPHYEGHHSQNPRFHGGGYGTYHQGRPHQNWNHSPPRGPRGPVPIYPKKMLPYTLPTNTSEPINTNASSSSTIAEDTSEVSHDSIDIPSVPISNDAPSISQTVKKETKKETPEAPVVDSPEPETPTVPEVVSQDIKLEDKKKVNLELVNLCEDLETPEERLNRFHFETRTNILQQLCGCQNESQYIMALRQFKEVLESQNGEIKMKYELVNLLGKYLPFLAKNYKVIGTSCVDEYLAIMEDIIVVYCNLLRDFINVQIARKKKRNLSRLAARIRYLLSTCLLYRMDSIIHCLFKVQLYPTEVEHSRMWTYIFVYFLKRAKYNLQSADYLRCYICWQKVKTIRGNTSSDEIDGVMCTRFNKSIAELKALGITCLSEIIESMENDPGYSVRDMTRRYWRWWNVERPKDFLADLEEPTTLILPGEMEDNHKHAFAVEEEIDPITQLFQDKRTRRRTDLTQIALNFSKDAEAGDCNFSFTNGAQYSVLGDDVSGPIIIGDPVTIEDGPDDLLVVPPKVMVTVEIDSEDDDDVIFVEEPKKPPLTAPTSVQTDNSTEQEVCLLSPTPAIVEEVPLEQNIVPEPPNVENIVPEPQHKEKEPTIPEPVVPTPPSEDIAESSTPEAAPAPQVVRSLFGDLTEEDLELEDTFHMDFSAEDSDQLPDIPDSLVLPKPENLFGDSDDEWSNLDMNTVLDSIGESSMNCTFERSECSAGLFGGQCNENVKVERVEEESPKKEKVVIESHESTSQIEKPKTPPPSNSLEQSSTEPPQTESQNILPEPLESSEMSSAAHTIENPKTTNTETKDTEPLEAAPLEHSLASTETEKNKTKATVLELNETSTDTPSAVHEAEPQPDSTANIVDSSCEEAAAIPATTSKVNEKIDGGEKEKQTLVIQIEQLSQEMLRTEGSGISPSSPESNSVESEDFWTCGSNGEEPPSKKIPDDIDDLQQIYLRGRHTDKSRNSSCSLEAPIFESLDTNEVQQFFDENLSKNKSNATSTPSKSVSASSCSNSGRSETPAPSLNSTDLRPAAAVVHNRDPRLEGGTETAKRYRPSKVKSPAHQLRQTWSEAIADAMDAITQGAQSYEEFICGDGELIIEQSQRRSTRTPSSETRPIVDFFTNYVPDIAPIAEDVRVSTAVASSNCKNNSEMSFLVDLASPCLDEEALTIHCRTILQEIKQEQVCDVDSSAHKLTPDWGNDDRHYAPARTVTSNFGSSLVADPSPPYSRENSPNDGDSATNGNIQSPMLYSPLLKDSRGMRSFYISDIVQEEASKVPNSSPSVANNNNCSRASPKQHSVTFLEQVSKEFYATEFGGVLDGYATKKDQNVPRTLPPKNKPYTQTAAKARSTKSPIRPHITAEAELLLPPKHNSPPTVASAIPSPAAWNRNSTVTTSRVDPQLHKSRQEPKKTKVNGSDFSHGRRREVVVNNELAKYKNPPQLDVKFRCSVTVKLKPLPKETMELFAKRKPSTPRIFKPPRATSVTFYENEKSSREKAASRRSRVNDRRESALGEDTGIVYAIFSEKFAGRTPFNRFGGHRKPYFPFDCQDDVINTPTGRKVRFEVETKQHERNHTHSVVRIDAEKRPSQNEPIERPPPKRARISHNESEKYPSKGILKKKARISSESVEYHSPAVGKSRVMTPQKRISSSVLAGTSEIRVIKRGRPKKEHFNLTGASSSSSSPSAPQERTRKKVNINTNV